MSEMFEAIGVVVTYVTEAISLAARFFGSILDRRKREKKEWQRKMNQQ